MVWRLVLPWPPLRNRPKGMRLRRRGEGGRLENPGIKGASHMVACPDPPSNDPLLFRRLRAPRRLSPAAC